MGHIVPAVLLLALGVTGLRDSFEESALVRVLPGNRVGPCSGVCGICGASMGDVGGVSGDGGDGGGDGGDGARLAITMPVASFRR